MAELGGFAGRLSRFAYLLAHPRFIGPRLRGGLVSTIQTFDKAWLHELNPKTILDIGANTGQFAVPINALLPHAHILSFEPLPDCFEQLKRNMAPAAKFTALNYGLGDVRGEFPFERNAFAASSSFLKSSEVLKSSFPQTAQSQSVKVRVERLDDVAPSLDLAEPMLVKIDVQGYEDRVLRGGEQTLRRAAVMLVELSLEPLYEGQPLMDPVREQITRMGFDYVGNLDEMRCPKTNRVLQVDGIFLARSAGLRRESFAI
jgi:FkbM family methyltransferase